MSVENKVAVVTGAGSGIGAAIANLLANRGAAVGIIDINEASAKSVAANINAKGGKAFACRADTSQVDDVNTALDAATTALGGLDIMVNNAGVLDGYFNVNEMDDELWRRVIDINLTGVYLCAKAALRVMLAQSHGRIINMASVAGLNGTGGGAAYVAAKHGVIGLTKQMAVAHGHTGITFNSVCPGAIPTALRSNSSGILGPDMTGRGVAVNDEQVKALVPAGVRGEVDDIAKAVCFLASDEASYINGHSLVVDGGWRAK